MCGCVDEQGVGSLFAILFFLKLLLLFLLGLFRAPGCAGFIPLYCMLPFGTNSAMVL